MPASDTQCFQVFLETLAKKHPGSSSYCWWMVPAIIRELDAITRRFACSM
jgi:hypothetical protein